MAVQVVKKTSDTDTNSKNLDRIQHKSKQVMIY